MAIIVVIIFDIGPNLRDTIGYVMVWAVIFSLIWILSARWRWRHRS